jgi:glycosyltransferase involved in cell wall biosynthesis
MDFVLPMPEGLAQRIKARIKGVLFRNVDLHIEYFRNTKGYETYYHMKGERFRYVPFKVNRFEAVIKSRTSDQGYVFSGGNTRRDFETLLDTARQLNVPFKIVTMRNNIIMKHGSHLDDTKVPDNVQVIRHDGSDSFIDYIAGSKMVVLPIKKKNISSSGIGVYLASMALGKCVVISSGVGVDDVLTDGQACIVPPEDPVALRDAITKLYYNDDLREAYARKGREYALSLGGEDRLAESAMGVLIEDAKRMSKFEKGGLTQR